MPPRAPPMPPYYSRTPKRASTVSRYPKPSSSLTIDRSPSGVIRRFAELVRQCGLHGSARDETYGKSFKNVCKCCSKVTLLLRSVSYNAVTTHDLATATASSLLLAAISLRFFAGECGRAQPLSLTANFYSENAYTAKREAIFRAYDWAVVGRTLRKPFVTSLDFRSDIRLSNVHTQTPAGSTSAREQ
jgi:hypothetical protein